MPDFLKNIKPQPIYKRHSGGSGLKHIKKQSLFIRMFYRPSFWIVASVALVIIGIIWFNIQLSPVGGDINQLKKFTIESGSNSTQVSQELEKQSIIRSAFVFDIYVRLIGKNTILQAGTYHLSPAESVQQIIEHFVNGSVDQFSITFYPGATLTDATNKLESKKYDVTTVLERAGYSAQEISTALRATYNSQLFAGKPANSDLEGYVYGETYKFNSGATVQDILKRTFDEFYSVIQKYNLVDGFKAHGLNLYQGITLASIIQRETSVASDQRQVAQVFYSRLKLGMMLGSDVTYQYIADKTGVVRDSNIDSPYNTRRYAGLPPGPISVPGLSALQAVANPAEGNYLYFLSGDNGTMYFATTNAEHELNKANYCKIKCSTP